MGALAGPSLGLGGTLPLPPSGKGNSKVKRWDIITVRNLTRNQYWGESNDRALRKVLCTCTLISGDGFRLLVDPSEAEAADMARELGRCTGLQLKDITAAVTHDHADHWPGLKHFPDARCLAGPGVAEILNASGKLSSRVEPITGEIFGGVKVLPTPGHTPSHHSLRFNCDDLSIVPAGDAIATRDFFRERRNSYNIADPERASEAMNRMARLADLIIPGHDNYLFQIPECLLQGSRRRRTRFRQQYRKESWNWRPGRNRPAFAASSAPPDLHAHEATALDPQ